MFSVSPDWTQLAEPDYRLISKPCLASAAMPAPLSLLKEAKQILDLPIVAIGGINAENSAALIDGGADILTVIHSLLMNTGDASKIGTEIEDSAHKLVGLFE